MADIAVAETVERVIARMPDGVWTNLKQGIGLHTSWDSENWRIGSVFPVKDFAWQQGITPWSDWQATGNCCLQPTWSPSDYAFYGIFYSICSGVLIMAAYEEIYTRIQASERPEPELSTTGRFAFLIYIYYLSKMYQLFDTLWLLLAKRPLRPIFVFHHLTALPLAWAWLEDRSTFAIWIILFDSISLVAAYYFYSQAVMGQPVKVKWFITLGQTAQYTMTLLLGIYYLIAQQMSQSDPILAYRYGGPAEDNGMVNLEEEARKQGIIADEVFLEVSGSCRGSDGAFWLTMGVHAIMLLLYIRLLKATIDAPIPEATTDPSVLLPNPPTTAIASATPATEPTAKATSTKRKTKKVK
ncbi:GNS1/SUR4 family-domain-containing protein [Syncephalis fuscata]|nr:GNS1/SUR4 family-domain-containing protein [Syncephalis fuscata]